MLPVRPMLSQSESTQRVALVVVVVVAVVVVVVGASKLN